MHGRLCWVAGAPNCTDRRTLCWLTAAGRGCMAGALLASGIQLSAHVNSLSKSIHTKQPGIIQQKSGVGREAQVGVHVQRAQRSGSRCKAWLLVCSRGGLLLMHTAGMNDSITGNGRCRCWVCILPCESQRGGWLPSTRAPCLPTCCCSASHWQGWLRAPRDATHSRAQAHEWPCLGSPPSEFGRQYASAPQDAGTPNFA